MKKYYFSHLCGVFAEDHIVDILPLSTPFLAQDIVFISLIFQDHQLQQSIGHWLKINWWIN